jgi:hypothetical protein
VRAALIYQHASRERDHEIAEQMNRIVEKIRKPKANKKQAPTRSNAPKDAVGGLGGSAPQHRTGAPARALRGQGSPKPVETRGIEPLTPALQRQCSAN